MKTKNSKLIAVVLLSILLIGCEKQPKSSFTVETKNPMINSEVKFTNSSENGESYEWQFGDGEKSADKEPLHSYKSRGEYTVKLISKSKSGNKTDSSSQKIKISSEVDKILGT